MGGSFYLWMRDSSYIQMLDGRSEIPSSCSCSVVFFSLFLAEQ